MKNRIELSHQITEQEIGNIIDQVRLGNIPRGLLVELLSERHLIYLERPSFQMNRIRGYALASFKETGLPNSAISFVLDELQNGRNAYMVAGAARGLRGLKKPKAQYVSYLIQAINNLRYHDDSLDLTKFKPSWPLNNPSTGKLEILKTLRWLRGYAKGSLPELKSFLQNTIDFSPEVIREIQFTIHTIEEDDRILALDCCDITIKNSKNRLTGRLKKNTLNHIGNLQVENQNQKVGLFKDVINKRPTIITFFYTRCMNPNKCMYVFKRMWTGLAQS